ncbi:hypothetical protein KFE98_10695 [bacterium SCSIO 12741]|nr:hypothetical protein KFE98_10695 [bacterium SCSIO 12741]
MDRKNLISYTLYGLFVLLFNSCGNAPEEKPAYPLPIDLGEVSRMEIITFPGPEEGDSAQESHLISTMHIAAIIHDMNRAKPSGLQPFKPTHRLIVHLGQDSIRTFYFRGSVFKEKGDFSLKISLPAYADSLWRIE